MQHVNSSLPNRGQLLPQPAACRRYGVSQMSLWRWQHRTDLDFPRPITIAGRKYFYLEDLVRWEQSLVRKHAGEAAAG
jgi:predicted DNA-binding transcriptional regulator AlpA